jgi:hypothetical protein
MSVASSSERSITRKWEPRYARHWALQPAPHANKMHGSASKLDGWEPQEAKETANPKEIDIRRLARASGDLVRRLISDVERSRSSARSAT